MEVHQQPKSCNMKQDNNPNGGAPASKKEDGHNADDDNYLDSFPPGYRFCPSDEELLQYYLNKKVMGLPLPPNRIAEVNLYSYNPERLAELHKQYGEKEWYFFTPREKKYRNGIRPNRAAGDGYWKATGADRDIKSNDCVIIGYRKALVFYQGKPPKGDKTNWIMHEYRVNNPPSPKKDKGYNDMRLDDYVLCRIYKKVNNKSVRTESKTEDLISPELPIIQNEDANEILASDDMINSSVNENVTNQMLPAEESLNNSHQIFDVSFLQDLSTNCIKHRFGEGDLWSAVESFVDCASLQICVEPLMNLDFPLTTSNAESQEFMNEEFNEEESIEEHLL